MIRRSPLIGSAIILLLAAGGAAATTAFAAIDAVLLRPLPYASPAELVVITGEIAGQTADGISPPDLLDYQTQTSTLSGLAAEQFGGVPASLDTLDGAVPVNMAIVSPTYFDVLGVPARQGRTFRSGDVPVEPVGPVVISHRVATLIFGSEGAAVNQNITINAHRRTVLGVMPASFQSPVDAEIWETVNFTGAMFAARGIEARFLKMIGRLRAGKSFDEGRAELVTIGRRLQVAYPSTNKDFLPRPQLLTDVTLGPARGSLWTLFAGAILIWLIGAINASGLAVAEVARRRQDLLTRSALGASPASLRLHIFIECAVLAVAGWALALWLTSITIAMLRSWTYLGIPRLDQVLLDATALLISIGLGMGAFILLALGPGALGVPRDPGELIRSATSTASSRLTRFRHWLVAAQVAVATSLLGLTGVAGLTYLRLTAVPLGFDADRILSFNLSLPAPTYPDDASIRRVTESLLAALRSVPGVTSAAVTSIPPLSAEDNVSAFKIKDRPDDAADPPVAAQRMISDEYFDVMRIPLIAGRAFSDVDARRDAPLAVIVGEPIVERYFQGRSPVGRSVQIDLGGPKTATIVGVVGATRFNGLDRPAPLEMYLDVDQVPTGIETVVVRTQGAPEALAGGVRAAVQKIDRSLALAEVRTMAERLRASIGQPRVRVILLAGFGVAAVLLVFFGILGVVSHDVSSRRKEIGVRLALGATPGRVIGQILREALSRAAIGVAVGAGATGWLTRLAASQRYGVAPVGPVVLSAVSIAMLGCAATSAALAARRIASIAPAEVLRQT